MTGPTGTLVDFVLKTTYDDLPPGVVKETKRILLDSVGCALGGYAVDRGKIAIELVNDFGGNAQVSIIGGRGTSPPLAAFANSELMNALDYDIIGPVRGHIAPYAIPPTLAAGERAHASGRDLIAALALAIEIGGRILDSLAWQTLPKEEPPYWEDAPRFTHSNSVFGGVAGAGKLLGLDSQKMANAFGITGASVPVGAGIKWKYLSGPAIMTKYNAWSGWTAQLAMVAALAAERGFTGDTTILDGELGFWKICGSPFFKEEVLTGELGRVWHTENGEYKFYPVCHVQHALIDAINGIIQDNGIKPEDIEAISIKCDPFMMTPNKMGREIKSFADTQFSNFYIASVAAYHGRKPGASWQLPTTFADPKITELMKKVQVKVHPRADEILASKVRAGAVPRFRNTIVEITAGGKKFTTEVEVAKGSPSNPISDAELEHKFRDNANYSMLRTDKVERAIEAIYNLEKMEDITRLMNLLTIVGR